VERRRFAAALDCGGNPALAAEHYWGSSDRRGFGRSTMSDFWKVLIVVMLLVGLLVALNLLFSQHECAPGG
jgi:hypothetical protein